MAHSHRTHTERTPVPGPRAHPNLKPISLIERIILCSSDPGDVVWDPYSGTGTTAVASLNCQRAGYASEIHPPYCTASQRRLANHQPKLIAH